jgi:hypothetical protein
VRTIRTTDTPSHTERTHHVNHHLRPVHRFHGSPVHRFWDKVTAFGDGDDRLKVNGIGEVIVYSAYDFENFEQPRPEISE